MRRWVEHAVRAAGVQGVGATCWPARQDAVLSVGADELTLALLVISCVPILTENPVAGGAGLLADAVLLVPWLVGVIVFSNFVWSTNPRRECDVDTLGFRSRLRSRTSQGAPIR